MTIVLLAIFGSALILGGLGFIFWLEDRRYEKDAQAVFQAMRNHPAGRDV